MIKFNSSNIISGYIKELLASFNLPCEDLTPSNYIEDKKVLNRTHTLETDALFYDYHTHEYLGEYLRYLRDYKKIDLMSLYNCFSNNIPDNLKIVSQNYNFSSKDAGYTVYMIPVKFSQTYTIAADSTQGIELICGFFDGHAGDILPNTYHKESSIVFSEPIIYNTPASNSPNEKAFKLFLKIPSEANSSIVILEGNYTASTESYIENNQRKYSKVILNFEKKEDGQEDIWNSSYSIPNASKLQLLSMNTGVSHPFADRLIEYLLGNAISSMDDISENIKRVQRGLIAELIALPEVAQIKVDGLWEERYKDLIYALAQDNPLTSDKMDILGYVDKDVEKILLGGE